MWNNTMARHLKLNQCLKYGGVPVERLHNDCWIIFAIPSLPALGHMHQHNFGIMDHSAVKSRSSMNGKSSINAAN